MAKKDQYHESKVTQATSAWIRPHIASASEKASASAPSLLVLQPHLGGGIGNYLFRLCHSILYAQIKATTLLIPRPLSFNTMNRDAIALDFSKKKRSYGDQIEKLDVFIHGNEITRKCGFRERYLCMQEHVKPLFETDPVRERFSDTTLVIHIRSGDIFQPGGANTAYGQPPLSWYQFLIERCGYEDIVVVTQTRYVKGGLSPVVEALRKRWPHVRLVSAGTEQDFHALRHARHLALSASTFGVTAAMLNTGLERLHVPIYGRRFDPNFSDVFPPGIDLGFARCYYDIRNYEGMRHWRHTPEQLSLMLEHLIDDITSREECPA